MFQKDFSQTLVNSYNHNQVHLSTNKCVTCNIYMYIILRSYRDQLSLCTIKFNTMHNIIVQLKINSSNLVHMFGIKRKKNLNYKHALITNMQKKCTK